MFTLKDEVDQRISTLCRGGRGGGGRGGGGVRKSEKKKNKNGKRKI